MYNQLLRVIVVVMMSTIAASTIKANEIDSGKALSRLDKAVIGRKSYFVQRNGELEDLKDSLLNRRDESTKCQLLDIEKIGDAYSIFNNDSALMYYTRGLNNAVECADDSLIKVFTLKLSYHTAIAGLTQNAVQRYESVDTAGMGPELKYLYYKTGRGMCYYNAMMYEHNYDLHKYWNDKVVENQRMMLHSQSPYTSRFDKDHADYYYLTHEYQKAFDLVNKSLESGDLSNNEKAELMLTRGLAAHALNLHEDEVYSFAEASRLYLSEGAREVTPLVMLAIVMSNEVGDILRAYEYTMTALENASDCNSVARVMQISPQLPIVSQARGEVIDWWLDLYAVAIAVVGVAALVIILIAYFLYMHIRKMKEMQSVLVEANTAKEVYISQFMVLCSVYMDKLNQFNGLVTRKLSAGQTDELYKLTKSGKILEEQTKDFYQVFDSAILHLYPNFVDDVNALLLPDEQLVVKEGELLNTDLRILACLRLGLDDANRIAQILNYSVNTIYAYRNRLRNRAVNRETFESDIAKI